MKNIFLIIALFTANFLFAQTWVEFTSSTPNQPNVQLIVSDNSNVNFSVEVYGMYSENIIEQSTTYQRINIPGCGATSVTGEPEMPFIRQLIAIPECDDVTLTCNVTGQDPINNYYIYPVPQYVEVTNPDGTVYLEEQFYIDQSAYNVSQNYPTVNAEIKSIGYLRDQKYAEVYIYPVLFNPVTQQLQLNTNYNLTLNFTNPSTTVNVNTGIFNNVATNTLLNYTSSGMTASVNDRSDRTGNINWISFTDTAQAATIVADYLIITDDLFYDPTNPDAELLEIAQHRAEYNGFDIAIVKVEEILSSQFHDPYEIYHYERAIRRFIKRVYEGANAQYTYDGKLAYVLIVGDALYGTDYGVPTSNETFFPDQNPPEHKNDYYYSCLTKDNGTVDFTGDLYIGRFSVRSLERLHNIISKTKYFECEADFGAWRDTVYYANSTGMSSTVYNNLLEKYSAMESIYIPPPYAVKKFDEYDYSGPQWDQARQDFVNGINDGCLLLSYYGHGKESEYSIGDDNHTVDTNYLKENLLNNGKYPFALNYTCLTGHFTSYPPTTLCEVMTSYSDNAGFVGMIGSVEPIIITGNQMTYPPRYFKNGYMEYVIYNNLSHITGEFILEARLPFPVQGEWLLNYFGDPALNIMAQGFEITQNMTFPDNVVISTDVYIRSGVVCNISTYGHLYFENNGRLIIDEGGRLNIHGLSTIHGKNDYNAIIINGKLGTTTSYFTSVTFTAPENMQWKGLVFDNAVDQTIDNCTFERCNIKGKTNSISITGGTFSESVIKFTNTDINIQNNTFINGVVDIENRIKTSNATISGCNFNNTTIFGAINIEDFSEFIIENNTINYETGDAISLYYTGGSYTHIHNIKDNTIQFTGTHSENGIHKGVKIYYSAASLENNLITNNDYGICCLDNSNIVVKGYSEAVTVNETQRITDNYINQLYSVGGSFPYIFAWNAVTNNINDNPLCYYESPYSPANPILDVRNNYWGDNFVPDDDLHPTPWYYWDPVWQLSDGGNKDQDLAEELFENAIDNINDNNYVVAETQLKQIIADYPESKQAMASVKELIELKQISDEDFAGLKTYYDTAENLQDTNNIGKTSDWLSNFCNVRGANYPEAIIWYDSIINNPETLEDSITAIIDLGYTYLLMLEDSLNQKSDFVGIHPEYKFATRDIYVNKRNELINLLFLNSDTQNKLESNVFDSKILTLSKNYPNPFKQNTNIEFILKKDGHVNIELYDLSGKIIMTIIDKYFSKGKYKINSNIKNLNTGIYYLTAKYNGVITNSLKIINSK